MSIQKDEIVFGFLANEVELMHRAQAYGLVPDLSQTSIDAFKSEHYTDEELVSCQRFSRSLAMYKYVRWEIIPKVAIPGLELRTVWVGDDESIQCFSMPLAYASDRHRTPQMLHQIKVLAKLIKTELPPGLWRSASVPCPPTLKGQKLPPNLANYRIRDLPF